MYVLEQEVINGILKAWNFNGAVSVIMNNRNVYMATVGMADFESGCPFTTHTTMELASLSKQFTAVAIMKMSESKLVDLESRISKYIPEYSHASEITIRNLLNHSSGIPDYSGEIIVPNAIKKLETKCTSGNNITTKMKMECINMACRAYSIDECLELVNPLPLHFIPGEGTAYSNTNYYFLSYIIEKVTGKAYEQYLREAIFEPLGMFDSHTSGLLAEAAAYVMDEDNSRIKCGRHGMGSGDSGVVSTIKDLTKWCESILNGKLLSQESWSECFKLYKERFGFGFSSYGKWLGHNGGMPGIATYERIQLENKNALILMCNLTGCSRIGHSEEWNSLVGELMEKLNFI
ncbi:serine hydrolase domain-containing protein [Clostridium sp. C8-1-8]|uniref:serine hydrolase domain-containing protein n=1 Tax=Clostridium sp. C8-1-8 TaxID=2698831 RepID=UPI00136BA9B5|nr:serine hydrolase domain-containing protein [Clostridium sp. C8-1-8]